MKRKVTYIFIIIGLIVGAFLSMDMYVPSFPSLMTHFNVKASSIQLSLSLFVMSFAFSQFISGVCSDKFGRKPVLIVGLSLFTLASVFTLFATTIVSFNAARILQGLGVGASTSLARIMLNDLFEGKSLAKTLSLISSLVVLTPAVAPFLGGLLQHHFDYYGSLIVMLSYGILLTGFVVYKLPETNHTLLPNSMQPHELKLNILKKIKSPQFIKLSLVNGGAFSSVLIYTTMTPFIFQQQFNYSAFHFGLVLLLMASGIAVGALFNFKLLNFFSIKNIVFAGLLISMGFSMLLFSSLMLGFHSTQLIIILIFGLNIGVGLTLANVVSMIFNLFTQGGGLVGAIYGFLRMFVAGCVGLIISAFHFVKLWEMSTLMMCANFIGFLLYLVAIKSQKNNKIINPSFDCLTQKEEV